MARLLQTVALASLLHSMSAGAGPISAVDIVQLDDTLWAQVDLFTELSWNDMNAVCPGGVCGNGSLNGQEMSGWRWATTADLNALFNSYLETAGLSGMDLLDPVMPDHYSSTQTTWAPAFFADGWRSTSTSSARVELGGYSSDLAPGGTRFANIGFISWSPTGTSFEQVGTDANFERHVRADNKGGWFYRSANSIPTPSTIALLCVALFALLRHRIGYSRGALAA